MQNCSTSDLFFEYLTDISALTEIPKEIILSKNRSEQNVQARVMLCYVLNKSGFLTSEIAGFLKMSKRNINNIISSHFEQLSKKNWIMNALKKIILKNNP